LKAFLGRGRKEDNKEMQPGGEDLDGGEDWRRGKCFPSTKTERLNTTSIKK